MAQVSKTLKNKTIPEPGDIPFKVGDVLVIALAADINDLSKELISVGSSFCFIHM